MILQVRIKRQGAAEALTLPVFKPFRPNLCPVFDRMRDQNWVSQEVEECELKAALLMDKRDWQTD